MKRPATSATSFRPSYALFGEVKPHPYRTFINGVLSGNILIDTSQAATDTLDYVATDT